MARKAGNAALVRRCKGAESLKLNGESWEFAVLVRGWDKEVGTFFCLCLETPLADRHHKSYSAIHVQHPKSTSNCFYPQQTTLTILLQDIVFDRKLDMMQIRRNPSGGKRQTHKEHRGPTELTDKRDGNTWRGRTATNCWARIHRAACTGGLVGDFGSHTGKRREHIPKAAIART
jgi:hypothetical protein